MTKSKKKIWKLTIFSFTFESYHRPISQLGSLLLRCCWLNKLRQIVVKLIRGQTKSWSDVWPNGLNAPACQDGLQMAQIVPHNTHSFLTHSYYNLLWDLTRIWNCRKYCAPSWNSLSMCVDKMVFTKCTGVSRWIADGQSLLHLSILTWHTTNTQPV